MSFLSLSHVSKAFDSHQAVCDISFNVERSSFVALLGPSGCGKSTTLRLLAGLDSPTSGQIFIDGKDVTQMPPAGRGLSMVFQNYALFPHLTVAENILFGLEVRKVEKAERLRRLQDAADLLGLGPYLARKPSQLSGGQQQRVALGRAIVAQSPICLMDEPLSNLDAKLRAEMRREIRGLQQRLGLTLIYVTHDQVEAMTMADHIILMNKGRIEQEGSPADFYNRPETMFSASFVGTPPMNLLPASVLGEKAAQLAVPQGSVVGIRPEKLFLAGQGIRASVISSEYLGADTLIEAQIGKDANLIARIAGQQRVKPGDVVTFDWAAEDTHFFDASTSLRCHPSPLQEPLHDART